LSAAGACIRRKDPSRCRLRRSGPDRRGMARLKAQSGNLCQLSYKAALAAVRQLTSPPQKHNRSSTSTSTKAADQASSRRARKEQRAERNKPKAMCMSRNLCFLSFCSKSSLPSVDHRRPSPGQRDCSQKDRRHRRQQRRSEQKETKLAKVRHLASGTLFLRARPSPSLD
jgi:hypothetical protein